MPLAITHLLRRPSLAILILVVALAGCGGGEAEPASANGDGNQTPGGQGSPGQDGVPLAIQGERKPAPTDAAQIDAFNEKPLVVPENATAEELVEFLRQASARRTFGASEEDYLANAKQKAEAMIVAANRILAAKATAAARYQAAASKFSALQAMQQLQVAGTDDKLKTFAAEAPAIVDAIVAERIDAELRGQAIALKLNALFTAASLEAVAPETFLAELQTAATDKDPGVVRVARQIEVHYRMARLFSDEETDPGPLVAAVVAAVSGDEPDPDFFSQAREIASALEHSGHTDAAGKIAQTVGTAYAKGENEQLADAARLWTESVKKRLGVIGSEVSIDGTLSTGEPLDWPALRGKVVLVDFWATWCPPCLKLLPELQALHEKYQSQGFEIVGVSLDNDRASLDAFLAERKLPWPIVANIAGKPPGEPEPNADRYGVEAIPVVILVDKQGQAVALGLHGEKLEKRVKELLAE